MKINIITAFPKIFDSFFAESIIARAIKKELLQINIIDLRNFTIDNHKTIDLRPYGGGPGMILMFEPIYKALLSIYPDTKDDLNLFKNRVGNKIILTSPKGQKYTQRLAQHYSNLTEITLICGHYEGVDNRVAEYLIDEEISIGDYVLSGGEAATITIVDSIARLIPGSLGNSESLENESHNEENYSEYPQYTRPEVFTTFDSKELRVPEVLLSGNHAEIEKWRKEK